jgi:hypothetical protein
MRPVNPMTYEISITGGPQFPLPRGEGQGEGQVSSLPLCAFVVIPALLIGEARNPLHKAEDC